MLKPADFQLSEEQKEKTKIFYDLLADGREFYYTPFPDTLYADLNLTLTDKHLAMCMLRNLDGEVAEAAGNIMKTDRSKRSKVMSIAKLVKDKTIMEIMDASETAVDEIDVPKYIIDPIKKLKPSRLVLWTDTPRQTADLYVRKKVDPIYNSDGKISYIILHATELQHTDGVLTGNINFIPDEYFRHNVQHLEYLDFLKKVAERIA
jgi:hypothetical protein